MTPAEAVALCLSDTHTEWGSSRWAAWNRCRREHHLAYDVGIERISRDFGGGLDFFSVGKLLHAGLQYHQLAALDRIDVIEGASQPHFDDVLAVAADGKTPPEVLDEAHRLLTWYFAHWGTDNAGWPDGVRIVEVERPVAAELGGLPYTSRIDSLLEIGGLLVIADHKTRQAKCPDNFTEQMSTNPQFLGLSYCLMTELGLDYAPAVMANVIVKTKMPQFARVTCEYTIAQVEAWAANQAEQAAALQSETHVGSGVTMNYSNCHPAIGRACDFAKWCHGSEETRSLNYRKKETP